MNLKEWSGRLVWATMLVMVVRYAATFAASDVGQITGIWSDILTTALSITGVGMGILDTVGGGLLFNGWSRVFPKVGQRWSLRFKVLTICVFGLLVSGLFILVPFTMSRISHESILDALGGKNSFWAWAWSFMVNVIPYILIGGIFTGNKLVTSLEEETYSKHTSKLPKEEYESEKVTSNLPVDWRKIRPTLNPDQVRYLSISEPRVIVQEFAKSGISVSPRTASNWKSQAIKEINGVEDV